MKRIDADTAHGAAGRRRWRRRRCAMPFVRRAARGRAVVPNGKMVLAWHTNIAARWLDPQQHDGTATPDNFLMRCTTR